ncbi:unnamed protein product [Dicrocoelium dendriticum]|nr:unnamed protein product [Dicrocoelium dendriticum]
MRTCFGLLLLALVAVRASRITFPSRDECISGCERTRAGYIQICLSRRDRAMCNALREISEPFCSYYCERNFPSTSHQ